MNFVTKLFGKKKEEEPLSSSSSSESEDDALLIEEQQDMIRGIEDLSETSVSEIMIPRTDVHFLSVHTTEDELLKKIAESGHSRFPIYNESIDDVIGILYVKDLIMAFAKKESIDLEKIIRKPYFVPESKKIDSLLREFRGKHIHIAVVIDEYGGISGIVCMEDIIEEIVGDIQDEFDKEAEGVVSIGDNVWLCDARINLDDLNEKLGTDFQNSDYNTLGGFVFDLFDKIPVKFEKVSWKNFDLIVQGMKGHRVASVKLIKNDEEDKE